MLSFASAFLRRLTASAKACAAIGVAIFCFSLSPPARAQKVRVAGVVRDASGASIAGAQVELHAKPFAASTITDSAGAFTFDNVPESSGTLVVTANGFQPATAQWTSSAESLTQVAITLSTSPLSQQVEVTANRATTLTTDVPVSDVQLTREDLQQTPALTLDDDLRQVPGFSLYRRSSSRTANPTTQGVSLRGLGANGASRALVLQDGIPLNDPFGGWVYWDRIPAESVADVEIAQEGASSLYGSDALGGVVQFVSRPAEPAGVSLETSYGNQDTPDLSLWAGGKKGKWESTFAGEVFHTDGYVLVPEADRGPVDTKAGSEHGTADLMVGRKIGEKSEIFARGWYLDETRGNGTVLQRNDTKLGQGALGANLDLGDYGALTLRFYGDVQTYHQNFSSVTSVVSQRDTETLTDLQTVPAQGVGGSALWSRQLGTHQSFVAGFDDHEEIGASHDVLFTKGSPSADQSSGGRQRTLGIFGEDLIQITPRWLLSLSARVDHWSNFNASLVHTPLASGIPAFTAFADRSQNAFSPRATLRHQVSSNISWDASVYRAFRAPSLNELYRSFRQGNTTTQSNADLTAEHLTGGDSGISAYGFKRRLEVRGTFFYNQIIDPVANVTCQPPPNALPGCPTPMANVIARIRENLGRISAPGFDAGATVHFARNFDLSAGYQFVNSRVVSFPAAANTSESLVGLWVAQVPHNAFTFQARYSNPRIFFVSVDGRFVGKQFDDDQNQFPLGNFFVLDAMASRSIGAGLDLFAAAENLFNEKYATAATPIPQLGLPIAARIGLRYQFPKR